MPGDSPQQLATRESHVLNDAILMAAQELAHRPRENRKIIFVISDGQELGSRASYAQVLKVLLTDEIAVYAIGVDKAAMPVYSKLEKARIPGFGYSNILPRYTNATGGDVLDEFSKESIEERLPAHNDGGAQSVHAGLQHAAEALEQVPRYRSAREAAGVAGLRQAWILPVAPAADGFAANCVRAIGAGGIPAAASSATRAAEKLDGLVNLGRAKSRYSRVKARCEWGMYLRA